LVPDLTAALLFVELVLLIATLSLILLGRREARGREKLAQQMMHTARMVSRQEYFNSVHFAMQSATHSIKGAITGSSPLTTEVMDRVQGIADQIRGARARNVSVQYLLPKSQDRLIVASKYHEAGAEIRLHPGLLVSDMRYTVVDGKYTVIGLASTAGENQPTREGYVIPSEGLAQTFAGQFQQRWNEGASYDDYLRDILKEVRNHNPDVSVQLLSSQLHVAESEINRILATTQAT
jgi:hypothetical protein